MAETPRNITAEQSNFTDCNYYGCIPDATLVAAEIVTAIFAVCGSLGNLLTVVAIMTSNLRSSINSILIGHLSTAQIIYCSIILPFQALTFHRHSWPLHHDICVFEAALRIWIIGVDMMLLSAIAFFRFIHIVHYRFYADVSSFKPFIIIVVFCWLFPLIFSLTPVVGVWGSYSFHSQTLQCTFTQMKDKSHKLTTITLGYVIPVFFIVFCYARIGCTACFSRKRIERSLSEMRKHKVQKDSFRLTAMMLCIFCLFLLGTTPYFTVNILDSEFKKPLAHIWAPFMAWFMYCMNPVVYTVMDANFHKAFKRLLLCQIYFKDNFSFTSSARNSQAGV